MINVEWQKGAPDKLEAGMVVRYGSGPVVRLIGSCRVGITDNITEWAWLIKPYQLEWVGNKCKI